MFRAIGEMTFRYRGLVILAWIALDFTATGHVDVFLLIVMFSTLCPLGPRKEGPHHHQRRSHRRECNRILRSDRYCVHQGPRGGSGLRDSGGCNGNMCSLSTVIINLLISPASQETGKRMTDGYKSLQGQATGCRYHVLLGYSEFDENI